MVSVLRIGWRLLRWKAICAALIFISSLCNLVTPLLMGALLTALGVEADWCVCVIKVLALLFLISLLALVLGYVQSEIQIRSSAYLDRDFRQYVWQHLMAFPVMKLYGESPSVWMQKICGDASMACGAFRMLLFSMLNFAVFFIGICICVFRREPLMIIVFVLALLIGFAVHRLFRARITLTSKSLRECCYVFNATTFDILMLHPLIRMLRLQHIFEPRFGVANGEQTMLRVHSEKISNRYNLALQIEMLVVHFVVLVCCIWLFVNGRISIGEVVSFDLLVGQLSGGITNLLSFLPQIDQGVECAMSIAEILRVKTEDQKCEITKSDKAMVELHNVSFEYHPGERTVLSNITALILKNDFICCCGGNGAGKTTLMNIILGILKPTAGTIAVSAIRPAVIPQRVVVFRDSVLENVRMCDRSISQEMVYETLIDCGLSDWVRSLPDGLNTQINCDCISGGELQRIGIARALIRKPDLLVVDEVVNNLDVVEKIRIRKLIDSLRGNCTILAVTHDLESAKDADCVWVIKDGRIVEIKDRDNACQCIEKLLNEESQAETCC